MGTTGVGITTTGVTGSATLDSVAMSADITNRIFTISSGNADDNGYGNFEYSPNITGDGSAKSFYALNTKNLAEFG